VVNKFRIKKGYLAEFDFGNDKEGKPVGIRRFIGSCPILAFGNSDWKVIYPFEMLKKAR
jgi:hypothetical protein